MPFAIGNSQKPNPVLIISFVVESIAAGNPHQKSKNAFQNHEYTQDRKKLRFSCKKVFMLREKNVWSVDSIIQKIQSVIPIPMGVV